MSKILSLAGDAPYLRFLLISLLSALLSISIFFWQGSFLKQDTGPHATSLGKQYATYSACCTAVLSFVLAKPSSFSVSLRIMCCYSGGTIVYLAGSSVNLAWRVCERSVWLLGFFLLLFKPYYVSLLTVVCLKGESCLAWEENINICYEAYNHTAGLLHKLFRRA